MNLNNVMKEPMDFFLFLNEYIIYKNKNKNLNQGQIPWISQMNSIEPQPIKKGVPTPTEIAGCDCMYVTF